MNNDTENLFLSNPFSNQTEQVGTQDVNKPGTNQVNLENVEDFTNICRTCATVTEFVIPIFIGEGLQNNLADKINKYLPIQVLEDDDLPQAVCYHCASTVLAYHELVQCCLQSDTTLKARLEVLRAKEKNKIDDGKSFIIETNGKFKDLTDFVVESISDQHIGSSENNEDTYMICEYCGVKQSEEIYPEHLITMHSEQLLPFRERDPFQYVISDDDDAEEEDEEPARKPKKAAPAKKSKEAKSARKPKNTEPAKKLTKSKKNKANNDGNCTAVSIAKSKTCNKKENARKSKKNPMSSQVNSSQNILPSCPDVSEDLDDGTPLQICGPSKQTDIIDIFMESVEKLKVDKKKKRFRCKLCPREFTVQSSYSYHFRNSHGNKAYECDNCGKKFRNKQTLSQHTVIHNDKTRLMECKYCLKKFRSKANLYSHEQIHLDLKKWPCSECNRAFRWRTHLLRHMKRHSAEKPLVCLTCGRRFNVPCDLRRHMRTHTVGNYNCQKCNQRFSQLRYLRVHMQKKHNEIIDGN